MRAQRLGKCRYASSRLTPHSSQLSPPSCSTRPPTTNLLSSPSAATSSSAPIFAACSRHASWQLPRPQLPPLRPPSPTSPPNHSIRPPPRLQTLQREKTGRRPCKSFWPGLRFQWCVCLLGIRRVRQMAGVHASVSRLELSRDKGALFRSTTASQSFSPPCPFYV